MFSAIVSIRLLLRQINNGFDLLNYIIRCKIFVKFCLVVQSKITILSSFINPYVVSNLHDLPFLEGKMQFHIISSLNLTQRLLDGIIINLH